MVSSSFHKGIKMKNFKLVLLCMYSTLAIVISSMSFAAEQKSSLQSDPRYVHAVYFLQSMNMDVDKQELPQKVFIKGNAQYISILKANERVGLISRYNDQFMLSIASEENSLTYKVILSKDNDVIIEKLPTVEIKNDISKSWAQGACQYTSKIFFYFGCASDDNPVGLLRETSTWVGDPITWNQYTWRQNYLGQTFVCPINTRAPYNPYRFYTCGLE